MQTKIILKHLISTLLSFSGIHSRIENYFLTNKAFILTYHRVLENHLGQPCFVQPGMFVTAASFKKQIEFLNKRYNILFLKDLIAKLQGGEDISGSCALTFDDGWLDNYTEAFPVLKEQRVPATVFLASGFIGKDRLFWPEEICYYLNLYFKTNHEPVNLPRTILNYLEETSRYFSYGREIFFDKSIEELKGYSQGQREEILECFRNLFKLEPISRQMLNWDEIREMYASGFIQFGAHTVNHEILDKVPFQIGRNEISKSLAEIGNQIGCSINTFAYPNGNHNEYIRKYLVERGVIAAVTTQKGFLEKDTPPTEIPRIAIHEDVSSTIPMFRSRILLRRF